MGKVFNRLLACDLRKKREDLRALAKLMVGTLMGSYYSGLLGGDGEYKMGSKRKTRTMEGCCWVLYLLLTISCLSISLFPVSHQVEKFLCSPCPTITFWPSTWSQATMTWILWNHELKQSLPAFSCLSQLFVTEGHEKWWAQPPSGRDMSVNT